jgi:sugar phosphate isomerase/epimerase
MAPQERPIGLQLYTVRRDLDADVEGTLAAVAAIGFTTVELAGLHGYTPEAFRAALDGAGLQAVSGHVQFDALGEGWADTLDEAAGLGQRYVVCAAAPRPWFRSRDAVRRLAERLNRAGERAEGAGLRFAYHNHDFEFAPAEGGVPFEWLVSSCDPRFVDLQLDLGWVREAGHDPDRLLRRYAGRVPLLHVGEGEDGDLARSLVAAGAVGVEHVFVEYDDAPPPALASAARSYRQVRGLW